jgi:hypothetical protein
VNKSVIRLALFKVLSVNFDFLGPIYINDVKLSHSKIWHLTGGVMVNKQKVAFLDLMLLFCMYFISRGPDGLNICIIDN